MDEVELATKRSRARKLRTEELLFLYLTALWGSIEGGIWHVGLGANFGLSEGTITNYINYFSLKGHRVLKEFYPIGFNGRRACGHERTTDKGFRKSLDLSIATKPAAGDQRTQFDKNLLSMATHTRMSILFHCGWTSMVVIYM
jgi:hypothetical protein